MSTLNPPRINTQDVHEGSDASDDHFSSASEGQSSNSPIPITRVERVDDSAAHGEVPGTPAYDMRVSDAVPDEIEVIPEGRRSRSHSTQNRGRASSQLSAASAESRPQTPGGTPIPKTVVEKVDFKPSYGEVEGTPAAELRMADAIPDEIRTAPAAARMQLEGRDEEGARRQDQHRADSIDDGDGDGDDDGRRQEWFRSMWESDGQQHRNRQEYDEEEDGDENVDIPPNDDADDDNDDDDFGDDFDEFAEGGGDDDFGDFDGPQIQQPQHPPAPPDSDILSDLPSLTHLHTCSTPSEIAAAIDPYLTTILPTSTPLPPKSSLPPLDSTQTSPFLSERSHSLWQQLVSPPPMQPPNWTRSRIRRLFLVSLGVPVDLDEILPPSKQARLVLPSISGSPPPGAALQRLRDENGNDSTTSIDSKTGQPRPSTSKQGTSRSRPKVKGPPGPPVDIDLNLTTLLCRTTPEALQGMSDEELQAHAAKLQNLNGKASQLLEYWLMRRDEGLREKEALEGVIERVVGFVKGRKGGGSK